MTARDRTVTSSWLFAARLQDLPPDTPLRVDLAGRPIFLARSRGSVHALTDECSHGQVALSEGEVEDGYVECWLHGSRFDLATGEPTGPPATRPVAVHPVRVDGQDVFVSLPDTGAP
ncbi:MAG: Rieske (2Fe-2S) iron-sulfur protein [Frankiales bacterium]|nr:Rieske (2Fe-2S) iron-sulfur protein [Frankiales bacterium]